MNKAYILGGMRSFIGIEKGIYRNIPGEKLGAMVLQKTLEKYGISKVDMIIGGNGVGGGGNITRLMALEAGLDSHIPAMTVDVQCGSGLESIAIGAAKIQTGQADIVVAGGFESSSTAPRRGYSCNHPDYEKFGGENSWYKVAKFMPDYHSEYAMLEGAERTAKEENVTRQEMDQWALLSHKRAVAAREKGVFEDILVNPLSKEVRDEGIRERMSERLLKRLPPVLSDGERITAGNACLTNDGAAFVILCSEKYLKKNRQSPLGEFVQVAEVGGNPMESPKTAITAIEKLLYKTDISIDEIGAFECNEAFAVIDVLFQRKFPRETDKYNIFGGALAYGHPYGASGGIIMLHLLKALEEKRETYGVCSIAAAGGIGTAVLIKKV